MEQRGFPWHARAQDTEKTDLSEPDPKTLRAQSDPEKRLSDLTNRVTKAGMPEEKSQAIVAGKKRAGSMTTNPAARPSVKFPNEQQLRKHRDSARPPVRTIPAWVRSAEEDDLEPDNLSPDAVNSPDAAYVAHHNCSPSITRNPLLDHDDHQNRKGYYPTSSGGFRPERTSRWISFARASAYPSENLHSEKVDTEWLDENFGDYAQPWLANHNDDDVEEGSGRYHAFRKKRQVWYKRSQFTILRNPFIPLVFRLINLFFAAIALALGASIYIKSRRIRNNAYQPGPSAEMAVIVDAIALVYIGYITYDEYFSKPLGLRSARAKVRLILLDLFFITFQASNLALGFESVSLESGACKVGEGQNGTRFSYPEICARAEALASVLLISLITWLLTFTVSVFRLVERINQG